MRIEATTQVTYSDYLSFFHFNFMQGKRSPLQAWITLFMPPVLFIIFAVLVIQNPKDLFNLVAALIMLFLMIVLGLILWLMPRRYYRSIKKYLDMPCSFVFDDDHFIADSNSPLWQGHTDGQYEMLHRVYETDRFFYVYINSNQAHLVGKADISVGSAAELRQLFLKKLGNRFIITRRAR